MNGSAKDLTNGQTTIGRTKHGRGEALLAALPYLLIGIVEVVIRLLTKTGELSLQSEQVIRLNYAMLIFLAPNRPMKCEPNGRLSSFQNKGTDMAGCPVILQSGV